MFGNWFGLVLAVGQRSDELEDWYTEKKIQIEESVVRTICNTPSSPIRSDNVKCASTEGCVQSNLDGMHFSASCTSTSFLEMTNLDVMQSHAGLILISCAGLTRRWDCYACMLFMSNSSPYMSITSNCFSCLLVDACSTMSHDFTRNVIM